MDNRVLIREARIEDAGRIAKVHVDTWRTTYRGIVPDARLDSMSCEGVEPRWLSRLIETEMNVFHLVAENESGEIVGFASAGPPQKERPPYKGELHAIYLLKEYQGKGIGRLLMQTACRRLHEMGLEPMLLWVFTENHPSRAFYERMGGKLLSITNTLTIGGKDLEEVAYGWENLGNVLSQG